MRHQSNVQFKWSNVQLWNLIESSLPRCECDLNFKCRNFRPIFPILIAYDWIQLTFQCRYSIDQSRRRRNFRESSVISAAAVSHFCNLRRKIRQLSHTFVSFVQIFATVDREKIEIHLSRLLPSFRDRYFTYFFFSFSAIHAHTKCQSQCRTAATFSPCTLDSCRKSTSFCTLFTLLAAAPVDRDRSVDTSRLFVVWTTFPSIKLILSLFRSTFADRSSAKLRTHNQAKMIV